LKQERFGIRDVWIIAALFAANLLVLGPWLLTDFSNQPWNNGFIYMAISRMFRDGSWGWNPLQYGGAPLHYLYPPIFHVLVGAMPVRSIGLAFHLVTGIGYAMVPVALYVLARQLFGGRLLAVFVAIVYSVCPSPVYVFAAWRNLAVPYFHAPWGFVTLVAYEEAAHTFALSFTLLSVAAGWRDRWVTATLLAAAVLLTNWPALIGLVLLLGALAVAKRAPLRTAALGGTAYGLAAFWITPGYIVSASLLNRVVLRHTAAGAPFNRTAWLVLMGAAILIGVALWRGVPARIALPMAWVAITGAVVVTFTLAGANVLPWPHRFMLEFNVGLVLMGAALISLTPSKWQCALVAIVLLIGGITAVPFIGHAWKVQAPEEDPKNGAAYRVADWLNRNAGGARSYVAGELDGALALWSNVPQVGGSGQDVSNFLIFAAERQVGYGCGADSERIAELWLRALNVGYLAVHGAASREYFHWFAQPEKFAVMPVAWDNGAGDAIYRVPGFDGHEAVVVDRDELARLPRFTSTRDAAFLDAYVHWAAGKRPVSIRWNGSDEATLDERLAPNEAILVKINNDRGWHVSDGATKSDPIGFLLIDGTKGRQVRLSFKPSWDVWLGRAITCVMIIGLVLFGGPRVWMAAAALIPAMAAYAILMAHAPSTVAIAEDAFVHLQPPIINPGGIVDGTTNRPSPFKRGRVVAAYGLGMGAAGDAVRVWVGERSAEVVYHGPNLVSFRMPTDAPAKAAVSVEVNGCRGNEFAVDVTP
jgi:hypothetical protein